VREPSFEELEKLAKKGRCLNCGRKPRLMIPLYQNPVPEIYVDMLKRFKKEEVGWLLTHGGVCVECSEI
jgi:hypothetical protein